MKAPARALDHPVHQVLNVFPLGVLATAVVFDLLDLATGTGAFNLAAYWLIAGGVVARLLAVPFGLVAWVHLPPGTRARRLGALHGAGHLLVVLLFTASWLLRMPEAEVPAVALLLSFGGAALVLVTAWLGAGVEDDLALDARRGAGAHAARAH